MKIHDLGDSNKGPRGGTLMLFHCPGCGYSHPFEINAPDGRGWSWNGSFDRPTFQPSLLCNAGSDYVCHSFVTDGKIQFLSDCWHHLKGQTVEVPDWETS